MNEAVKVRLTHALLSMLLAAGILLPLLGIMDPSFLSPAVLLWCAGIILLFELASVKQIVSIAAACAALIALAFWLFALDGLLVVSDVILAIGLRFTGVLTALPLVASSAVILTVVLITLAACFACLRSASFLPAFLNSAGLFRPAWFCFLTGGLVPSFVLKFKKRI